MWVFPLSYRLDCGAVSGLAFGCVAVANLLLRWELRRGLQSLQAHLRLGLHFVSHVY